MASRVRQGIPNAPLLIPRPVGSHTTMNTTMGEHIFYDESSPYEMASCAATACVKAAVEGRDSLPGTLPFRQSYYHEDARERSLPLVVHQRNVWQQLLVKNSPVWPALIKRGMDLICCTRTSGMAHNV